MVVGNRRAGLRERAAAYDDALRADDPRFAGSVRVVHDDGSLYFFEGAFAVEVHDRPVTPAEDGGDEPEGGHRDFWYVVFTEHQGYHVFHADEVEIYRYACDSSPIEVWSWGRPSGET